ncbi:MAG: PIN domain-containing protein [Dehalococcoidia bacterium]
MAAPALVDTGALVAATDSRSRAHALMRRQMQDYPGSLIVPVTVLPEADYLVQIRLGVRVELELLRSLASTDFQIEHLTASDLTRSITLIERYADAGIGLVDASLVAIAERLGIEAIFTLDHRHFRMVRPRHCPAFTILPD